MADVESALVLRMEASLSRFERQMARARQTGSGTARDIETRFDRMGQRMGQSSARAASGLGRVINISSSGRFVLQNTANQLGDVAVQLQGGTQASRVLAQQLPQMLGGFGALGGALGVVAPLLGVVAAVGIPVAAMVLAVGRDSEDAAEKVETFADKLKDAQGALDAAESAMVTASAGGLDDLREKYGEVTKAVTELADALADIEVRAARIKVGNVIESVSGGTLTRSQKEISDALRLLDGLSGRGAQFNQLLAGGASGAQIISFQDELGGLADAILDARAVVAEVDKLGQSLGISGQAATDLALSIQAAREAARAEDFAGVANRLADARDAALAAGLTVDNEIVRALTQAQDVAAQMAKQMADAEANASGVAGEAGRIVSPISDAADEAARLSGNLATALADLAKVTAGIATAQRRAFNQLRVRESTIGDPGGRAAGLAREEFNEDSGGAAYEAIRSGNTSLLSDMADESDTIASNAERIAEAEVTLQEAEREFLESLKTSSGGGGGGGGAKSRAAKAINDVGEEITTVHASLDNLSSNFASTFAQIITGAQSAEDAIRNLAAQIVSTGLQASLGTLFDQIPLFSRSARGNVFAGGNLVPFARGGIVSRPTLFPMANGAGLMGEAGPEAILPLRRGSGGRLGVEASAGGSVVNVPVTIENHGAEVSARRSDDGGLRVIVQQAINGHIAGGGADKALGQRFALRPATARGR